MRRLLIVSILVLSMVLPGGAALAESPASCVGLGISDHAQWGEMPETVMEVKSFLEPFGLNLGAFVSRFAQRHEGTHVPGCEQAAEDIIGELIGS
ncbi:MAG: hypothetical protein HY664_03640 [Chloroflexi bacterium]|nr:hypothetical protein [Chloroflexota bacterium]